MKRLMSLLIVLTICLIPVPLLAPNPPGIWVTEEWYNEAIETIEWRIEAEEVLEQLRDHIILLQDQVNLLTGEVGILTTELNETDIRLDIYRQKYNAQKGFYAGGGIIYPIGINAIALYKFDRLGLYINTGYTTGFYVGAGGMIKIGR